MTPTSSARLVDAFAGVAGNALTIDHIGSSADPQPLLARRARPPSRARAKAEQYAALAGRELGKVRELCDVVQGGPQPRMAMMASRAADTSVELGENTVTTTVVVRWDWK